MNEPKRPITICRAWDGPMLGWHIYVGAVPVTGPTADDIDRSQIGKQTVGPAPHRFEQISDALTVAMELARYVLELSPAWDALDGRRELEDWRGHVEVEGAVFAADAVGAVAQ